MKARSLCVFIFLSLFAVIARAAPVEDLPKCEVIGVDRTNLTFSVKLARTNETRLIQITSETRFFKETKPAISEDMAVGDTVFGKVHRRADGVYEAVRIYILKPKQIPVASCGRTSDGSFRAEAPVLRTAVPVFIQA